MNNRTAKTGHSKCIRIKALLISGLTLIVALGSLSSAHPNQSDGWLQADKSRNWSFPSDLGTHPEYRTEWWYFTGMLRTDEGEQYGYQLTFFRQGIRFRPAVPKNPWSVRDIYLAHFAVTDVTTGQFLVDERVSRVGPGLAGGEHNRLAVHLLDWSVFQTGEHFSLFARSSQAEIRLDLVPSKPLVFHGDNGLSRKGERAGQASYYMSYTRLQTTGSLRIARLNRPVKVSGTSWFDHEFGSNQLSANQTGWDWFSLRLSDGQDLMIYLLRKTGGSTELVSSGTLVDRKGRPRHLDLEDFRVEVLDHWRSPKSGARYPSSWRIEIPSERIDLVVRPVTPNQELFTPGSTGVTYWEGAVQGEGTSGDRAISAEGYTELTGYAGSMGGTF